MVCPVAPVELEVEGEVRCDILPATVGHEAAMQHLAHIRVH